MWAAKEGHEAVVALLLENDEVEVDSRDYEGRTPLWFAAMQGQEAVVRPMLESGKVDVNSKDRYGQTPLLRAAEEGHETVVRLLLANSSRPPLMGVSVEIQSIRFTAEIGTGAGTTLMSMKTARDCNLDYLIDKHFAGVARGLSKVKVIGRVHSCAIRLARSSYPCSFTILEGDEDFLLLGLDFLKRHGAFIDFHNNKLKLGEIVIPMVETRGA